MPAPGDDVPLGIMNDIEARTHARDSMTARMMKVAPSLFHSGGHVGKPGPVFAADEGDTVIRENRKLVAQALKDGLIRTAGPGAVMAALDDPLYRTVERALLPYTNIGSAGCGPQDQWRAAEHFRPFFAIPALVEAIAPLVKPLSGFSTQELEDEIVRRTT